MSGAAWVLSILVLAGAGGMLVRLVAPPRATPPAPPSDSPVALVTSAPQEPVYVLASGAGWLDRAGYEARLRPIEAEAEWLAVLIDAAMALDVTAPFARSRRLWLALRACTPLSARLDRLDRTIEPANAAAVDLRDEVGARFADLDSRREEALYMAKKYMSAAAAAAHPQHERTEFADVDPEICNMDDDDLAERARALFGTRR